MEHWLEFAKGPFFRFSFLVMLLGLARNAAIAVTGMVQAYNRAGDKNVSWFEVARNTAAWLIPVRHLNITNRLFYTIVSFVFHIATIIVPIFLYAHIQLWRRGLGISWAALPQQWADWLTVVVILTGLWLVIGRLAYSPSRSISRFQDVLLPPLIVVSFITGFAAAHPHFNPFSYQGTLLVHVLSGDILLLLIPFSKLTHVILWPFTQLATELAWRFPPDAGSKIVATLGKEDKV